MTAPPSKSTVQRSQVPPYQEETKQPHMPKRWQIKSSSKGTAAAPSIIKHTKGACASKS